MGWPEPRRLVPRKRLPRCFSTRFSTMEAAVPALQTYLLQSPRRRLRQDSASPRPPLPLLRRRAVLPRHRRPLPRQSRHLRLYRRRHNRRSQRGHCSKNILAAAAAVVVAVAAATATACSTAECSPRRRSGGGFLPVGVGLGPLHPLLAPQVLLAHRPPAYPLCLGRRTFLAYRNSPNDHRPREGKRRAPPSSSHSQA